MKKLSACPDDGVLTAITTEYSVASRGDLMDTLTNSPAEQIGIYLVDGHVHFHECFDVADFISAATRNFAAAAAQCGVDSNWIGCLLLTDTAGQDTLRIIRRAAAGIPDTSWSFQATNEDGSLLVFRENELRLIIVSGRQINTSENIELLALGCDLELADEMPLEESLQAIGQNKAIPVLPWGFGKWWFRRGRIVEDVLRSYGSSQDGNRLFLGDNGGRLRGGPRPRLFGAAEKERVRVLPGSDPLPFASHMRRAGSHGFVVSGQLDRLRPAERIKQLLREIDVQPRTFGRLQGPFRFFGNQVAMQCRKLRKKA